MFKLVTFALAALAAVSTVSGAPIVPRQGASNSRALYTALGCQNQQGTQFFDDCCQPLKMGETPMAYCSNTLISEPSSSPVPESTPVPNSDDDCEDNGDDNNDNGDEDCEDPSSSPVYEPSSTPPSVPTPYNDPNPTSTPTSTLTPFNDPNPSPTSTPILDPSPSSSTDNPMPSSTPDQNNPPNQETHTGGDLTWFTQGGVAGACGQVHSDSDFVAALDTRTYGDTGAQSPYCGKTIRITWQNKSVDVIVADACPTCDNASSVDLSEAAFQALAPLDTGLLTGASWVML